MHNYTRYSWPLAIAALVTILAGCFAPLVFTLPSSIDFTNTGQIGDTIGGTMSPFVGIAGVIMTFVAFMMQVRANEIQRDAADKFRGDDCLGVFNEISKKLDKALEEHTEENIRNKFEGKI